MSQASDRILIGSVREKGAVRLRRWAQIAVPLGAILFQVYVPRFFPFLAYLEMPLLVTVYFALLRRNQIGGTLIGAVIGLVQDSLSSQQQPIGMFGISKTIVGYLAASAGMRLDVEHTVLRFVFCFAFFYLHQFLYWALARMLLGQQLAFDLQQTFIIGLLNAAVGISLFHFLDKLKERS